MTDDRRPRPRLAYQSPREELRKAMAAYRRFVQDGGRANSRKGKKRRRDINYLAERVREAMR